MLSKLSSIARKPALQQGSIVILDQGLLSLASFSVGILLARSVSTHEYGLYVLAWSLILTAQGVHRNLIVLPLLVHTPRMKTKELYSYQGSTLAHTLICACTTSVMCLIAAAIWPESSSARSNGLNILLPVIAITIPAIILREYIRQTFLAQLRIWVSVGVNLLATIIMVILICLLFWTNHLNTERALLSSAIISYSAAAIIYIRHRHEFKFTIKRFWPDFVTGWRISKWASLNVIGFFGISQIYPWLLAYLLGYEYVAIFGACIAVSSFLNPIMRGANAYILPRISHGYHSGSRSRLLNLTTKAILALMIPYTVWLLLAILFREELVPLFYTDAYKGYSTLFVLLVLKTTIDSVSSPLAGALQTEERAGQTTAALIAGALVTVTLGPVLIMSAGLTGAGITAVVASSASAIWKFIALTKVST